MLENTILQNMGPLNCCRVAGNKCVAVLVKCAGGSKAVQRAIKSSSFSNTLKKDPSSVDNCLRF